MKVELSSQRREMLLLLTTSMANQQQFNANEENIVKAGFEVILPEEILVLSRQDFRALIRVTLRQIREQYGTVTHVSNEVKIEAK